MSASLRVIVLTCAFAMLIYTPSNINLVKFTSRVCALQERDMVERPPEQDTPRLLCMNPIMNVNILPPWTYIAYEH